MGDVIHLPISTCAELEVDIIRIVKSWTKPVREQANNGDAARLLAQSLTAMGWKK